MQTDIQKSNENATSTTTESKTIPQKNEYLAKIDAIPTVSFNKEQKAIAKKIIENTDEKDLNAVFSLITQRVKTGFVFDEAPEVNHDCVALVKENKKLNINIGPLSEMEGKIEHKLIIGENYDALKNLCATYINKSGKGLIDVIYLDPPYNTEATKKDGNDYKEEVTATKFIYRDKFTRDGWLNMMNERLKLAKRLLSDKGVIFISINDSEQAYLKVLCDEVFGEENFVGDIIWESKTKSQNTQTSYQKLQPKCEYVLCYGSSGIAHKFNLINVGKKEYDLKDETGVYREYELEVMNANDTRGRESMIFPISDGISTVSPEIGKQWKLGQDKVAIFKNRNRGDIFIRNAKVIIKMRPDDERNEITAPFWAFFDKSIGTAESAKKELDEILGKNHKFDTVKSTELIKKLLFHASSPFSLILDFFAGSGTTGQAVMELNEEDGGKRKFILVTNNENSIGEKITRERLYRVINGNGSNGETIAWTYSKEKPYLQNNAVRTFTIEHIPLTLNDLDKAENLKETAQKEFVKLNPLYTVANEFDIYNELAALNPQKDNLPQNEANVEAKK